MKTADELIVDIQKNPSHGYLLTANNEHSLVSFADKLSSVFLNAKNVGDLHKNKFTLQTEDASIKKKVLDEFLKQTKLTQGKGTRVFIINKAETLTPTSANSLLKSLEEPGENTVYVLTSLRPSSIISTIRSRLQQINIPNLSHQSQDTDPVANLDSKEVILIKTLFADDPSQIEHYSSDAESRTDLVAKVALVKSVIASDVYDRTIALKPYWKDKDGLAEILSLATKLCKSALHSSASANDKARKWANASDVFLNARERAERNVSPRLVIMELVVQL